MTTKSLVILTNFWDANFVIDCGFTLFPCDKEKYYKINFDKKNKNYSVYSIALRHPEIDKKLSCLGGITTLDFFCPTYDMLKRYKEDGNWEFYTKDYLNLMRNRKEEVKEWIRSLTPNHVYLLCCWENTAFKAKCHRQLLFDAFNHSKLAQEKMILFYSHGEKKMRQAIEEGDPNTRTVGVFVDPQYGASYDFTLGSPLPVSMSTTYSEQTRLNTHRDPTDEIDP